MAKVKEICKLSKKGPYRVLRCGMWQTKCAFRIYHYTYTFLHSGVVWWIGRCSSTLQCNPLQPSGHYIYIYIYITWFNIQKFHVLPTHCIYVFCMYLRTNSDLCHLQNNLIGFYNRDLTLYSPVVTICTASLTISNSTFCPHSVFMCFVWISEQTAIISLYSINWLVFITQI